MMRKYEHLYGQAVHLLPTIGETHWLKVALSINRFADRYPNWNPDILDRSLERTGWHTAPCVSQLLHRSVDARDWSVTPRRSQVVIARGLFPLAYTAAHAWFAQEGLNGVVLAYQPRAIHEGTYLGHGLTVWCSFAELLDQPLTEDAQRFALERFVEFASKSFPGYPTSDPAWQPPRQPDVAEIDPYGLLDACLQKPGFFGHHLLTLGYLLRHRHRLTPPDWRAGLHLIRQMTETVYQDAEDNVQIPPDAVPADATTAPEDLERALLALLLAGPENPHSITLADIVYDLWTVADQRQQRHLLHLLGYFTKGQ